jgi:hypothetical protein
MPERVNMMKIKCLDQMFNMGFKPSKKDYKNNAKNKKEKRLAPIK